jgi:hypothetical protein
VVQKSHILTSAVLLAILAGVLQAADVSGAWSGTMSMGDNQFTLTYSFKQDGAKLTGNVTGPGGEPIAIQEGKVEGDKLTFSLTVEGPNGTMKFVSEGTVKGEEIALTTRMAGGGDFPPNTMTLKRSK